jgi:dihydroorotate dehydrogenase electron transfer subunit
MHQTFTITEIRTENYRTKTFIFDKPLPDAQPGQYVMAWLPDVGEKPFSIAGNAPLALMVVAVGPFSEALHRLHVGDRVWVRGPLGQGFALHGQHHLLVGGGYGVAPLLFLARTALAARHTVEVCIGARTAEDVLLAGSFVSTDSTDFNGLGESVKSVQSVEKLMVTTEDGSMGEKGLVTQTVEAAIAARRPDCVYACGPGPMLAALARLCQAHGLPHQLSWEAHLRCGLGICGSCELDAQTRQAANLPAGWLVCKDGPVMRKI